MSMESATTALADASEQRPLKSMFGTTSLSTAVAAASATPTATSIPQQTPVVEGNPYETAAIGAPRERERTERFARDINAKIDALDDQMGRSTRILENAQACVREALDQQQAAIDAQRQQLDTQQAEIDRQRKTLEVHGHNLSGHTTAIATHSDHIDKHQTYLAAHAEQLNAVEDRQEDLQHMLHGLSQDQENTAAKLDVISEQLYDVSRQASVERSATQQRLRQLGGALIGATVLTLGVFTYFLYNPVAAPKSVEEQLATIHAALLQQKDTTTGMSGDLQRIGASLTLLEGTLAELQNAHTALQGNQQASRDDIAKLQGQITSVQRTIGDLRARMGSGGNQAAATTSRTTGKVTLRDTRWVASRPAHHYVIQLVGSRDLSGVQRYADKNANALRRYPVAYAKAGNKQWYNLVYGDFATMQQAKNALASLPASLRTNEPWIRPVKSLR